MNFFTFESNKQGYGLRRQKVYVNLAALILVIILLYFDNMYFAPTAPLSRLHYCLREVFFEPLSEVDGFDGKISGLYATVPRNDIHLGTVYQVLQFSNDGSVTLYFAADKYAPNINAHRVAIWIDWLETPSL